MGNTENVNGKMTNDHNAVESQSQNKEEAKKEKNGDEPKKGHKLISCLKTLYIIIGVLAVTVAVAMIIVTILTSIATRAYDADQSSRIAAMLLLAVTAAVAICMVIYMEVATLKCESRPMCGAATVILILAIVQALISGLTVKVEPTDEAKLLKSLADSFKLAKDEVPRHYKLWSMTQYDLNCCGIYGPEDYRTQNEPYYFPPNVPISCCPSYDPERSDLVQERERETCKATKSYYATGCKDLVLMVFNETSVLVLTVTVLLILSEVVLLIVGVVLYKKLKNNKVSQTPNQVC